MTGKERSVILRKWSDLMIKNADDLVTILTVEQGKPTNKAEGGIVYSASFMEFFEEEAKRI